MHNVLRSFSILMVGLLHFASMLTTSAQEIVTLRDGLHRLSPASPQELWALFQPTGKPLPFVSAHRGGATKGFPENCIATFEHTLAATAAMLEIDPRYTADGAIVIHHDVTLDRTTTGVGPVNRSTLADIKQLKLKDPNGHVTEFTVPTLDETIEWANGKTILVLDQKDVPTKARVAKITEHAAEAYVMIITNSFKDAAECHSLNPKMMMEVMIPNLEKAEQFNQLGIPWNRVVAFVGHVPPTDRALYDYIHRKGASCMVGSSRNVDRKWLDGKVARHAELEPEYRNLLSLGADVIETDVPTLLGPMLSGMKP